MCLANGSDQAPWIDDDKAPSKILVQPILHPGEASYKFCFNKSFETANISILSEAFYNYHEMLFTATMHIFTQVANW